MWERACSRWGHNIQHLRRLSDRHREQARSHIGSSSAIRSIPDQNHLPFLIAIKQVSTLRFLSWTGQAKRKRPCQRPSPKAWPGISTSGEAFSSS
ncbi:hypothetical protein CUN63_29760 [Pseudomonas sp. ACM7]|nr:hypothetical protein CUN63_29760 [Pseudomonas sp. ACM7]